MSIGRIVQIVNNGVVEIFLLAGPALLVALLIGLLIGILQAVTSIQEQTLTFVPKILGILGLMFVLAPWLVSQAREYTLFFINLMSEL